MKRLGTTILLLLAAAPGLGAGDPALDAFDQGLLKTFAATRAAGPLVFHYEASALDPDRLAAAVRVVAACFDDMQKRLDQPFAGQLHVFLYPGEEELAGRLGVGKGIQAVVRGERSLHQVAGTVHTDALRNALAAQFPRPEDAIPPEPFFERGLTGMLAGEVEGEPPHVWAAVCLRCGVLPSLVRLRRSWGDGKSGRVRPVILAGSFLSFVAETYGPEKLKGLYQRCLECEGVLGRSFARVEQDWIAKLAALPVDPGVEEKLRTLIAAAGRPPPAWVASGRRTPLLDGKSLDRFTMNPPKSFLLRDGKITGTNLESWAWLHTKATFAPPVALRVKVRLVEGNALGLALNHEAAGENVAILARWDTFLTRRSGGVLSGGRPVVREGVLLDLLLVSEEGNGGLYLNGVDILAADGDFRTGTGSVGVGVSRGRIEVEAMEVIHP
ncbi:MAG: hypothetical protein MUE73_12425 [Planctomycetes bacterium]|nr:hypothetical protein [Planctomycetota bacterium]